MELSYIWVSLVILVIAIGKPNIILYLIAFTSSFTATALVSFTSQELSIAITWGFVTAYIILTLFILLRENSKLKINQNSFTAIVLILLFWVSCLLSTFFNTFDDILTTFKRFLFFSVGIFFSMLVSLVTNNKIINNAIELFKYGALVSCAVGLITRYSKSDIFIQLFNTSISKYAIGWTAKNRICGPSVEPSIFAECIGIALAVSILDVTNAENKSFKKYSNIIFSLIFFSTLFLSTSFTTFPVLLSIMILILINTKRKNIHALILLVTGFIFFLSSTKINDKLNSYSGNERLSSIINSCCEIYHNPLVCYGFGSHTSHDLFVNIFINNGFISALFFLILISYLISWAIKSSHLADYNKNIKPVLWSCFTLLVINVFTGFSYPFCFTYLFMGLLISCINTNTFCNSLKKNDI